MKKFLKEHKTKRNIWLKISLVVVPFIFLLCFFGCKKQESLFFKINYVDYYGDIEQKEIRYNDTFSLCHKDPKDISGLMFVGWYYNEKEIKKEDKFNFNSDITLQAAFTPNNVETENYEIIRNNKDRIIKKYKGFKSNIFLPNFYDGNFINMIGFKSFYRNEKIEKVIIPKTVEKIGKKAFDNCINLKEVNFNKGLKEIGEEAFSECRSLKRIVVPKSVERIGRMAFSVCVNLIRIILDEGLKVVEEKAFYYCKNLTSIIIPKSVIIMGEKVFSGCSNIKNLNVKAQSKPVMWHNGWNIDDWDIINIDNNRIIPNLGYTVN